MATYTVKYTPPVERQATGLTLTLGIEEAKILQALLYCHVNSGAPINKHGGVLDALSAGLEEATGHRNYKLAGIQGQVCFDDDVVVNKIY